MTTIATKAEAAAGPGRMTVEGFGRTYREQTVRIAVDVIRSFERGLANELVDALVGDDPFPGPNSFLVGKLREYVGKVMAYERGEVDATGKPPPPRAHPALPAVPNPDGPAAAHAEARMAGFAGALTPGGADEEPERFDGQS